MEPMKLQNAQSESFRCAREGRIGNYNVQTVLDALIRAVSGGVSSEHDNKG